MLVTEGFFPIAGQQVAYRRIKVESTKTAKHAVLPEKNPTLVFLHEGLGCIEMWKDFPERVAEAAGLSALVYSRPGYGRSDPVALPRPLEYMHHEAQVVLPQVLKAAAINRSILIGHSDGASIAVIYAGSVAKQLQGLVLLAPHVFFEKMTGNAIRQAGERYRQGELRERLLAYHGQRVDNAFWGWHDTWLQSAFRHWNIESFLPAIQASVLLIQGEDDQYGSMAQAEAVQRQVGGKVISILLPNCGHSPQQDQFDATFRAIVDFADSFV